MFDRFVTSMNSAWNSTKQAVQDSVEFAKDNTTRQIQVSDVEVQQANDKYEKLLVTIKYITMKVELLNSEFLSSSQHLIDMTLSFNTMINCVHKNQIKNSKKDENQPEADEAQNKIVEEKQAIEEHVEKVKKFAVLIRNLAENLIPKYVLKNFEPIQTNLLALKESKDAVHKICLDMDLLKKQMTGTMTKPIVGKMQKPQQKLASLSARLATVKPEYLNNINSLLQQFYEAKKNSYTALMYYEQQYLLAIEKYLLNLKATPSCPPFTDYSDMTGILPNYLQLLTSKKQLPDEE